MAAHVKTTGLGDRSWPLSPEIPERIWVARHVGRPGATRPHSPFGHLTARWHTTTTR